MKIYTLRSNFSQSLIDMKSNFKFVFSDGKFRMLIGLFVLFLQWMSKFSVLLVILHAFNIDFETIQIYIRQWVVYVTMLFIPTPGASGGAEASFLLIFGKSIPSNITYLVVSVWRLFTYYFILLTAVFLYTGLTFLLNEEEDAQGKLFKVIRPVSPLCVNFPTAVSYTHLDVYKRQEEMSALVKTF